MSVTFIDPKIITHTYKYTQRKPFTGTSTYKLFKSHTHTHMQKIKIKQTKRMSFEVGVRNASICYDVLRVCVCVWFKQLICTRSCEAFFFFFFFFFWKTKPRMRMRVRVGDASVFVIWTAYTSYLKRL